MKTLIMPLLAVLLLNVVCTAGAESGNAPATGSLRLLSAYYTPDPKPPADSNQVEGLSKPSANGAIFQPLQNLHKGNYYAQFGGGRIVVQNVSDSVVQIDKVMLNGKPIEESYVDFLDGRWDDRGVVWYRVRPKTLAPGECGEVYVRFRRHPAGSRAKISVGTSDGKRLEAVFGYKEPGLRVDYVTTDADQRKVYVYARRTTASVGSLTSVSLDGKLLSGANIYGASFPGNVGLAIVELPEPLKIGDYHIAQVTTSTGRTVAAQFRVLPSLFMRTGFHWNPASKEEVSEVDMNFVWSTLPFSRAEELGIYSGNLYGDAASGEHARMRYTYLFDEPDAKDIHPDFAQKHGAEVKALGPLFTGQGYAVGLGRNARQMVESGTMEDIERRLPQVATYIITNGTTRPMNWFVYGQLTDIASTDPYPANFYGADWTSVREQYDLLREAAAPRPIHACLEAYVDEAYSEQPHPDGLRRSPSAAEFRQMAVQAVGSGAKGINSWFWGKGSGMLGANYLPDIRPEYIRINKLTKQIERELLLGTPADIVTNDSGLTEAGSWYYLEDTPHKLKKPWMKERVSTRALLCGPDAIVVTAANHIPASRTKPEAIKPASGVNVTVQLPDFLREVRCFEVDDAGLHPYACRVSNGKAVISIDSIESGRVFLLRRP